MQKALSLMFDEVLYAPLNVIVSNITKPYSKTCPKKWKFLQRKILQVLRNQNKDMIIFFGSHLETVLPELGHTGAIFDGPKFMLLPSKICFK